MPTFSRARFSSPCPFCGYGLAVEALIRQSADGEKWMHPICARYYDNGRTFKDLQQARRIARRARELSGQPGVKPRVKRRQRPADLF